MRACVTNSCRFWKRSSSDWGILLILSRWFDEDRKVSLRWASCQPRDNPRKRRRSMPRILTPATHSEETLAIAHDLLSPGWDLVSAPHGRPEFLELLKDTEYYIGAGQFKHGPEFYQAAPKLRIVQTLSAGYNTYDLEAARAADVPICNNGGANATAVAEHAVMLMLAVSRKLIWQHEGVVSGRWRGNDFNAAKLYELEDKTLGIVGLGNIGKKVV